MSFRQAISGSERVRVVASLADERDRARLKEIAAAGNWKLQIAPSTQAAVDDVRRNPAVLLCGEDWHEVIETLRAEALPGRVIVTSTSVGDKLWLAVLESGGYDVVGLPLHERRLMDAVMAAWREIMK